MRNHNYLIVGKRKVILLAKPSMPRFQLQSVTEFNHNKIYKKAKLTLQEMTNFSTELTKHILTV